MGLKNDDSCLDKVGDDEPIFVIRSQDQTAAYMVREWIHMNNRTLSMNKIRSAWQVIDDINAWQRNNPDKVKSPD